MENNIENERELIQAQGELWSLTIGYLKSMSLKCALDLGIADAINDHGQPMTLSQLHSTLSLPDTKKPYLYRLLCILTHVGFLEQGAGIGTESTVYNLTLMSRLVLKSGDSLSLFPLMRSHLDLITVKPSLYLGDWFKQDEQPNPFRMVHDCTLWEMLSKNSTLNTMFNDGMERFNIYFMREFLSRDLASDVLKGVNSLVDVGGGTGTLAKGIAENYPHIECTVLDLPQVISGIPNEGLVKFAPGDMFNCVPPADAIILKRILHDWCDEDCIKILQRCKEAIASRNNGGKVIVIENMIGSTPPKSARREVELLNDMIMMTEFGGGERDELQWKKLFTDAGFGSYQINHTIRFLSIIELYM